MKPPRKVITKPSKRVLKDGTKLDTIRILGGTTSGAFLLRAYREFEERIGEVRSGRGATAKQVREAVLARRAPVSIYDIEAACAGVSRDTVCLVLRVMKKEGMIAFTGNGNRQRGSGCPRPNEPGRTPSWPVEYLRGASLGKI